MLVSFRAVSAAVGYCLVALSLLESDVVQLFSLRGGGVCYLSRCRKCTRSENSWRFAAVRPVPVCKTVWFSFWPVCTATWSAPENAFFCRVQHSHRLRSFVLPSSSSSREFFISHIPLPRRQMGMSTDRRNVTVWWSVNAVADVSVAIFLLYSSLVA